MKRFLAALIICASVSSGHAFADAFSLDEVEIQSPPQQQYSTDSYTTPQTKSVNVEDAARVNVKDRETQYTQQNVKLQDAVLKIESAQTDVKTQLATYEAKLTEIKTRQKAVLAERRSMEQNIRDVKKRMRSLDSAMKKINTNMRAVEKAESL